MNAAVCSGKHVSNAQVDTEELAQRIEALRVEPAGATKTRVDEVLGDVELLELCAQLTPSPEERDKLVSLEGLPATKAFVL